MEKGGKQTVPKRAHFFGLFFCSCLQLQSHPASYEKIHSAAQMDGGLSLVGDYSTESGRTFATIRPDPSAGLLAEAELAAPAQITEKEVDTYKEQDVSVIERREQYLFGTNILPCASSAVPTYRKCWKNYEAVFTWHHQSLQGCEGMRAGVYFGVH